VGGIDRVPCSVKLLPRPKGSTAFYDFDEYERLVEGAEVIDPVAYLMCCSAAKPGGAAGSRSLRSSASTMGCR
jgi:hypothetical protein